MLSLSFRVFSLICSHIKCDYRLRVSNTAERIHSRLAKINMHSSPSILIIDSVSVSLARPHSHSLLFFFRRKTCRPVDLCRAPILFIYPHQPIYLMEALNQVAQRARKSQLVGERSEQWKNGGDSLCDGSFFKTIKLDSYKLRNHFICPLPRSLDSSSRNFLRWKIVRWWSHDNEESPGVAASLFLSAHRHVLRPTISWWIPSANVENRSSVLHLRTTS